MESLPSDYERQIAKKRISGLLTAIASADNRAFTQQGEQATAAKQRATMLRIEVVRLLALLDDKDGRARKAVRPAPAMPSHAPPEAVGPPVAAPTAPEPVQAPRTEPPEPAASAPSEVPTPGPGGATAGTAPPAVLPLRAAGPGVRVRRPPGAPSAVPPRPGTASPVPE